jgi:hypothetical protein
MGLGDSHPNSKAEAEALRESLDGDQSESQVRCAESVETHILVAVAEGGGGAGGQLASTTNLIDIGPDKTSTCGRPGGRGTQTTTTCGHEFVFFSN